MGSLDGMRNYLGLQKADLYLKKKLVYVLTDLTLCLDPLLFTHVSRNSTGDDDRFGKQKKRIALIRCTKIQS